MLAAALLGGCVLYLDGENADGPGDDDIGIDECVTAADCVLAGPTCCDCPGFALPASSGWAEGCANVDCMMPPGEAPVCPALVATCDFGRCVATCAPVVCDMSCPQGFAPDPTGCLTCTCNVMPVPTTCTLDEECIQVPADCCGCARGGSDTAVPRDQVQQHLDSLGCGTGPTMGGCPDVSTCDPARVPRCLDGQCALLGPNDPGWWEPPPGACGRPDLPECPPGQVCVLNTDSMAGPLGLGVCAYPMP